MMRRIHPQQSRALRLLRDFVNRHRRSPNIIEFQHLLGHKSRGSAYAMWQRLEERGAIQRIRRGQEILIRVKGSAGELALEACELLERAYDLAVERDQVRLADIRPAYKKAMEALTAARAAQLKEPD